MGNFIIKLFKQCASAPAQRQELVVVQQQQEQVVHKQEQLEVPELRQELVVVQQQELVVVQQQELVVIQQQEQLEVPEHQDVVPESNYPRHYHYIPDNFDLLKNMQVNTNTTNATIISSQYFSQVEAEILLNPLLQSLFTTRIVTSFALMRMCLQKLLDKTYIDPFLWRLMIICLETAYYVLPKDQYHFCNGTSKEQDNRLLFGYYNFCMHRKIHISDGFTAWYATYNNHCSPTQRKMIFTRVRRIVHLSVLHYWSFREIDKNRFIGNDETIFVYFCSISLLVEMLDSNPYLYNKGDLVHIRQSSWGHLKPKHQSTPSIGIVIDQYKPCIYIVMFLSGETVKVAHEHLQFIVSNPGYDKEAACSIGKKWAAENLIQSSEPEIEICYRRFKELLDALEISMQKALVSLSEEDIMEILCMKNPSDKPIFIRDCSGQPFVVPVPFIKALFIEFKDCPESISHW
jgi:hypothetical protein